ncbi:uncharacterized protein [Asterias amurensis]|uniref:uncharacterized protein n=1 Tax=Asterias amurensis TaxID=7602 RepID=UPI003AB90600
MGASSGIGAETAVQFAASGCCGLALVGRNKDNLDAVCQQCQEKGMPKEKVLGIIADMAKEEEVQRIMDSTIQQFGQLDVLVNNAGMGGVKSLADDDILTIYDTVIKVNVRSMLQLTQLAVPHLTKTKAVNNMDVLLMKEAPPPVKTENTASISGHLTGPPRLTRPWIFLAVSGTPGGFSCNVATRKS